MTTSTVGDAGASWSRRRMPARAGCGADHGRRRAELVMTDRTSGRRRDGEVVHRHTVDGAGREGALHPRGDRRRCGGAPARTAAAPAGDEVMDLVLLHRRLELG